MSKPLKVTEEIKRELLSQITNQAEEQIKRGKLFDGEFKFSTKYEWETDSDLPIHVMMSPVAYLKICALVQSNSKEVGWHGTVRRTDDTHFIIEDVFVYPQEVTGSTVTPDYEQYCNWQNSLPSGIFNKLRFHGHSHVNMGTTPSGVDEGFQKDIVSMLGEEDFYIFLIINKSYNFNIMVYDMLTNTFYSAKSTDKTPEVLLEHTDEYKLNDFISDTKNFVKEKSYSYNNIQYPYCNSYNESSHSDVSKVKQLPDKTDTSADIDKKDETLGVQPMDICRELCCTYEVAKKILEHLRLDVKNGVLNNDYDDLIDAAILFEEAHPELCFAEEYDGYCY